jgi:hypothetical protein
MNNTQNNIPGFTAESSLYRGGICYASLPLADTRSHPTEVVPQIHRLIPFYLDSGCLCLGVEDDARGVSYVAGCVCP